MMGGRRKSYTEKVLSRRRRRKALARALSLLLMVGLVRTFLLRSYRIGTDTMEPSLREGDRVLTSPIFSGASLWFGMLPPMAPLRRGDLVIVAPTDKSPYGTIFSAWDSLARFVTFQRWSPLRGRFGNETTVPGIYRIIGAPGDRLRMRQGFFEVQAPGAGGFVTEYAASDATYALKEAGEDSRTFAAVTGSVEEPLALGDAMYFVASDDRSSFTGSFLWGPVPKSRIVGKPFMVFWPLSRLSFL